MRSKPDRVEQPLVRCGKPLKSYHHNKTLTFFDVALRDTPQSAPTSRSCSLADAVGGYAEKYSEESPKLAAEIPFHVPYFVLDWRKEQAKVLHRERRMINLRLRRRARRANDAKSDPEQR